MHSPSATPIDSVSAFDRIAETYDDTFERNPVTTQIRPIVWRSLLHHFKQGDHVLEINCGTGTDAIRLAKEGIQLTATDVSHEMIVQGRKKALLNGVSSLIDFQQLAFEGLSLLGKEIFDGAFSNFGGLNCSEQLSNDVGTLAKLLKPHARVTFCIINKISIWEIGSFLFRGNITSAFRRFSTPPIRVPLGDATINIRYYTPQEFIAILSPWYTVDKVYGLNIFSPTPNARSFVLNHPHTTRTLLKLDDHLREYFPWRSLGDHFVVEARRRGDFGDQA